MEIRTKQLLRELNISSGRLTQLAQEGLSIAKVRYGWWDREKALEWARERQLISDAVTGGRVVRDTQESSELARELMLSRIRLVGLQGDGQSARNDVLTAQTVLRSDVIETWSTAMMRIMTTLDIYVRSGETAHEIARRKQMANDLRRSIADELESMSGSLEAGVDLSPTRVRLS